MLKVFAKRAFDILVALFALIFLAPAILIIGLLIKKDSPGPIFYRGERVGKNGKPFNILKFRTMYERPESYEGPKITANGDDRITPFGKWLRETKLNELPQLWNVLKGEMSLVGPRPEVTEVVQTWSPEQYQEILSIRPGITSPASIIYRDEENLLKSRNVLDDYLKQILPDKLRLDQMYVRNQRFISDLDVLFMTTIAFLPRLRTVKIKERWFFSGPLFNFIYRIFTWFLVDVVVIMLAVGIAGGVWRISTPINIGFTNFLVVAFCVAVFMSFINTLLGLQRVKWRSASPSYVLDIGFSIFITCVAIWVVNRYWLTEPWIPFSLIWLMSVMIFIGLVGVRFRERLLTGIANRWLILRGGEAAVGEHIMVIGAGELGELAVWLLQRSAFSNVFGVVGLVDDDPRKQEMRLSGYKVLGSTSEIPKLVNKYNIGVILYAIAAGTETEKERILSLCHQTTARTVVVPDLIKVLDRSLHSISINEPKI